MNNRNISVYQIVFRISIIMVFLTLLPSHAGANDSIVYDNGHNVFPIETDNIRMVSEKITVVMNKTKPWVPFTSAKVTCDFLFENESNHEIVAEVGFPTIMMGELINHNVSLDDFRAFVEGKEATVNIKKETFKNAESEMNEFEPSHRYWYTWKVTFPPNQRLRIRNTYETQLSVDSVSGRWFTYILVTGANWKGKIERSVIEVIYPNEKQLRNRVIGASPEGFRVEGNRIIWDLRNFIPNENIVVNEKWINFRSAARKAIKAEIKYKRYEGDNKLYSQDDLESEHIVTPDDYAYYRCFFGKILTKEVYLLTKELYLDFGNIFTKEVYLDDVNKIKARVLRNEIFARHGRVFKSDVLREIFESTDWYKPNPNYSDKMLNDIERKNIRFILDHEKKMGWR